MFYIPRTKSRVYGLYGLYEIFGDSALLDVIIITENVIDSCMSHTAPKVFKICKIIEKNSEIFQKYFN